MKAILKRVLDIGEVAKESKLPPSTLRYYEEIGLIRSIGRKGLRRLFSRKVLEQLEFIALSRSGGFSLDEIAKMFSDEGHFHVDRKLLLTKANELGKRIAQLQAIQNSLEHVAHCKAPSHLECPKFLRLLHLAKGFKKQIH